MDDWKLTHRRVQDQKFADPVATCIPVPSIWGTAAVVVVAAAAAAAIVELAQALD